MYRQEYVRNVTLAPTNKKLGTGSIGKSGTGYISKSTSKSSNPSFGGKSSSGKSSGGINLGGKSSGGINLGGKSSDGKSSGALSLGGKSSDGKSSGGTTFGGKSSSGKSTSPLTFSSKPSSNITSSSSKNYPSLSPIYSTPKSSKSSTSFGIIWLPGKRHNKKKDLVYKPHQTDHKERTPSMYHYMSGDSPDFQPYKKKEEETNLLAPEPAKAPAAAAAASIGAAAVVSETLSDKVGSINAEEKQEFIKRDRDETKEAAGDNNESYDKNDRDYLENNEKISEHLPESKWKEDKLGDKVDSVYLRPPPPHKTRSTASTNVEEEDCVIKCLYYTMQCCDCVLM